MLRTRSLSFVVSWAVLSTWIGQLMAPARAESPEEAIAVKVTARLQVGDRGQPLGSSAEHSATLSLGESGQLRLGVEGCSPFTGGIQTFSGSIVWDLEVALAEVGQDQFTLRYSWSREGVVSGDTDQSATSEQAHISLRHDESVPIDLARVRRPDGPSCDVFVRLNADYAGSAALQDQAVRYELWLTHVDPLGSSSSTRLDLAGEQGEALGFLFDPVKLELPSSKRNRAVRLTARIRGHVRAWRTAGDRLMVVVEPRSSVFSAIGNSHLNGSSNGAGIKRFHVRSGETVKIVLPPLQGLHRLSGADVEDPLPPGLERQGDVVVVDFAEAFASHELALVIQASALD